MSLSEECKNAIFYANFLYKSDQELSGEVKQKLRAYKTSVPALNKSSDKNVEWSVTKVGMGKDTVSETTNNHFLNETSVVFRGKVISKYRKSTYCEEDDRLIDDGYTYYYGLGKDEKEVGLDDAHEQVAELLNQYVYTDICWDVQQHVRKYLNFILTKDFSYKNDTEYAVIMAIRNVIKENHKDPSGFKLHIIQSNTTSISSIIGDFPDNQLVMQSDQNVSSVFHMSYSKFLKDRIVDIKYDPYELEKLRLVNENQSAICKYYEIKKYEKKEYFHNDLPFKFTFTLYNVGE